MPKGPSFDSAVDYHGHSKHVHIELFFCLFCHLAHFPFTFTGWHLFFFIFNDRFAFDRNGFSFLRSA